MSFLKEIGLMKYLVLAFTLIFSMSGSVNADDHNTRYVLMFSQTDFEDPPYGINTRVHHSIDVGRKSMTKTATECYEDLKQDALRRNKNSNLFKGKNRFKIEIVDDVIISAKATIVDITKSVPTDIKDWIINKRYTIELHCLEITLD